MYNNGLSQFIPFITTILLIVFTNLLWGIIIGLAVSIFFIIKRSYENALYSDFNEEEGSNNESKTTIEFGEVVSFFNKGHLHKKLDEVEEGSIVVIDGSKNKYLDFDILDMFEDFKINAKTKDIKLEFIGFSPEIQKKLDAEIETED